MKKASCHNVELELVPVPEVVQAVVLVLVQALGQSLGLL